METHHNHFEEFANRLRCTGATEATIRSFQSNYEALLSGQTGMIPEVEIKPVSDLPRFETLPSAGMVGEQALAKTVIVKLNGGLGTSMGLDKAKSLLEVRDGMCFLDIIARHVLHLRQSHGVPLRFLVMNSFSTSNDSLNHLKNHPDLWKGSHQSAPGSPADLELLQSQVPKVDAASLRPIQWPASHQLEWCPPGHGDIYPSLLGSGWLERLIAEGMNFLFVSNSDNLGATLDLRILDYFAASGMPFLMEVAERTAADRKGGHLAECGSKLILRESAQCPSSDAQFFQDIARHRFFNTNNLWIRLDTLLASLRDHGGFIPLPLIKNTKTVDPRDPKSPAVFQLESAMGAAIGCFPGAGALVVPRTRFAPVKTTSDLFLLRSDAYTITEDWKIIPSSGDASNLATINLDPAHYRLVDQLADLTTAGIPSLVGCSNLTVNGPVRLQRGSTFRGNVTLNNLTNEPRILPAGTYENINVSV